MYYHAISHLLHHFSTNCPKRPEQFVVGLILNASFRPFVSVGACIFASLSSLPLSWFLSQISSFQNTRELVTAATTERAQQIKFPFNAAADSEHSGKGRSLLHSSAFASDHNQNVPLCVPASPLCECVCECVVGKFVLPGHLERFGAHGMRVPPLSLARFAEHFLKRDTPTPAGISTHQRLNLPQGLHC